MALHVAADHAPIENIQRGKQRRRAVTLVIVGHGPAPALLYRQAGLGAVQSLDLALFVDGKNERVLGRRHVKPDDILKFFNEFGVFGQFELAHAMRLKAVAGTPALLTGAVSSMTAATA